MGRAARRRCRRGGDPRDVDARCPDDRRHGRLWLCHGARGRSGRREPPGGLRDAVRDAPDRDQPALGARCGPRGGRRAAGARARRGGVPARRRDLRRGCRALPRDRRAWPGVVPRTPCAESRSSAQHPHPLQRRLARHGRLWHRHRADLSRARCRHPGPCLGGRDAPAQPGRAAHRVRAAQPRRAAYGDRRQCRRPADDEGAGGCRGGRHRSRHAQRRRLQQDRHLSEGARRARQ